MGGQMGLEQVPASYVTLSPLGDERFNNVALGDPVTLDSMSRDDQGEQDWKAEPILLVFPTNGSTSSFIILFSMAFIWVLQLGSIHGSGGRDRGDGVGSCLNTWQPPGSVDPTDACTEPFVSQRRVTVTASVDLVTKGPYVVTLGDKHAMTLELRSWVPSRGRIHMPLGIAFVADTWRAGVGIGSITHSSTYIPIC